jgi:hypothetical protein
MSRSNGEDTYALSSTPQTPATDNVTVPGTVTFHGNEDADGDGEGDEIFEVTLGGTLASATASAGTGDITVTDDDDLTDNISNGIANGDDVVINGEVYQVTNVAEAPAASIITVAPVLSGEVSEGTPISEITDFDVHLEAIGEISDPANPMYPDAHAGETYITITATSTTDIGAADQANLTAQVYASIDPSSTTYVRNTTDPTKNIGAVAYTSYSGESFYSSGGVEAGSGDIMEYAIVAEAGTGNSVGVSFSVTIPESTPYVANSTRLNNELSAPTTDDTGDPTNPDSALEGGMDACDHVSCILGLGTTLAWGGTAEATFKVELASALDPTAYAAPTEPALVAWTSPDDACWDAGLTPAAGWANGQCMMGGEPTHQAYCNTYADLQAAGSFDYDSANNILKVALSCE